MAIAFDSTGQFQATSASATNTAGNLMLAFITLSSQSDTPTAAYNGVSMTLITSVIPGSSGTYKVFAFYLVAPATGSNTLAVSGSTHIFDVHWLTYSGTKQSGQPDASNTHSQTSGTSITATVTTIADNSWTAMHAFQGNNASAPTAGSGFTTRGSTDPALTVLVGDSNAPVHPAGSNSMTVNVNSGNTAALIVSLAPSAIAANGGFFRATLI